MYNYQPLELSADEVIIYLRKSRSDDPLSSVEDVLSKHETILNEWVERNIGTPIPEENRYREVVSGETIDDRPEVLKVLRRIESPRIRAILVVEVQRLSRGDLEDCGRLMKLLRYTNTMVITPPKTYNLSDEYDRDIFERELKRGNEFLEYQKRIMGRGRLLSVSQGNFIGSIPPYGYNKGWITEGKRKCPTLVENPEEADVVRMIFDMYVNQGLGYARIAHALNDLGCPTRSGKPWGPETLCTILTNEHYIGKVVWNYRKTVTIVEKSEIYKSRPKQEEYLVYDGKHPAIISKELFWAAQKRMGRNPRVKLRAKVRNPLAGILYCSCGHAMSYRTYIKDGVEKSSPRLLCDHRCSNSSSTYNEIMEYVENILQDNIKNFEIQLKSSNSEMISLQTKLIRKLEGELEELKKKEIRQWEKYSEEGMPKEIFEKLNAKVLEDKANVETALSNAYSSMPRKKDYQDKIFRFTAAMDSLQDPDIDAAQKNLLLKSCIKRITYTRQGKSPVSLEVELMV